MLSVFRTLPAADLPEHKTSHEDTHNMLFHVRMTVKLPIDMPVDKAARLKADEKPWPSACSKRAPGAICGASPGCTPTSVFLMWQTPRHCTTHCCNCRFIPTWKSRLRPCAGTRLPSIKTTAEFVPFQPDTDKTTMNTDEEKTMSVRISQTDDVQQFFNEACGLDQPGGSPRMKSVVHRVLTETIKIIEDLRITPEEFWKAVNYLNVLGSRQEAGLLVAGLGLEHYLDLLMDAEDEQAGQTGGTRGPLKGRCMSQGLRCPITMPAWTMVRTLQPYCS